jgi:hypothetical protein
MSMLKSTLSATIKIQTQTNTLDFFFAWLLGVAPGSEKQSVHFALRDTMMSSRSPIASNLLLVNLLLHRSIVGKLIPGSKAASRSFSSTSIFPSVVPFFCIASQS